MPRLTALPLLFCLGLAVTGCEQVDRLTRSVMPRGDLQAALEAEAPRSEVAAVRAFYRDRDYEPLWVDDRGLTPQGDSLLQRLCQAATEGLRPEDYDFTRLDAAHERLAGGAKDSSSAAALAALDVALSETYLHYASDLSRGRVPLDRLGGIWKLQRPDSLDARATLDRVAAAGLKASVDSLFGAHSGYGNLRNALARYRSIYAQGGWGTVASARDRAGIARRLRATGDLGADSTDAGFGAAVQRFKQRHGLDSTATVNRATLDAMNVPVEQRIAQIEVNLERIRWMPADRGDTYLRVNIPTYGLEVYENGQRTMAMDVIVGDEANNTPVFSDTMTTVVFAPYWNVPKSIQEEELLPKGEAYLARNNFEFEGPTGLRQKPGNDNALGHVKFLFPNDMNIYLHDTPGRAAFNRDNRSLSHGCIRVSRPADLAVWVLGPNGDWDRGKIEAAMAGTEEQHIPLKRDIPVFIEYLTAWADDDGTVHFRKDIYGHDAKLATEIARTRRQTAGATCTRRLETAPAAPARDSAAVPAVALHRLRSRLRV